MSLKLCTVFLLACISVFGSSVIFKTEKFRVGIEYDNSMPMNGGSDRYRHRNNYEPFFVTITTQAKKGYVITYLDVSATVDPLGEVDFKVIQGGTGSKSMVFQLVSNNSDFLSYRHLAYGMREDLYRKITNIITIPVPSKACKYEFTATTILSIILYYTLNILFMS